MTEIDVEKLADAIEMAMGHHESIDNDSRCTCGVRNNMDGDVLFSHRVQQVVLATVVAMRNDHD